MAKYKKTEKELLERAREYYEIHSPKPVRERLEASDLDVLDFYHDMGILYTPEQHDIMWDIWEKNGRKVESREDRAIRIEAERQIQVEENKKKKLDAEIAKKEAEKQAILDREAAKEAAKAAKIAELEAQAKAERERLAAIEAKKKEILAAESVAEKPEEEKTVDEVIEELQ